MTPTPIAPVAHESRVQELQKESAPTTAVPGSPTTLKTHTSSPGTARRGSKAGAEFMPPTAEMPKLVFKKLKNPAMATYMDVAVIRCLFITQWIEDGVDWALHFLTNRLDEIKDERAKKEDKTLRSQSLPNIKQDFRDVRNRTTAYVDPEHDQNGGATRLLGAQQGHTGGSMQDLRRQSAGTVSLHGDLPGESRKSRKSSKEDKK